VVTSPDGLVWSATGARAAGIVDDQHPEFVVETSSGLVGITRQSDGRTGVDRAFVCTSSDGRRWSAVEYDPDGFLSGSHFVVAAWPEGANDDVVIVISDDGEVWSWGASR
jgi:hypothetical protein